jgi:hypothetical protein
MSNVFDLNDGATPDPPVVVRAAEAGERVPSPGPAGFLENDALFRMHQRKRASF